MNKNRYEEMIKGMSEKELTLHLYATQIILLMLSTILGLYIYRDVGFFINFFNWEDLSIIKIGVTAGLGIVSIDLVLMKLLPKSFYDDGGLNEKIFCNKNIFHIAFIAMIVAFCEELLFRGIIQTQLGLIIASLIFAVIHYRYLFNMFLFINIVTLSFVIGYIYDWTGNLAVTFVMHFSIDFLLGYFMMKKSKKS